MSNDKGAAAGMTSEDARRDGMRQARAAAENFAAYEGESLHFPDDAAPPELAFLSQHRATIFLKK